jgi:HEAT repeat protein
VSTFLVIGYGVILLFGLVLALSIGTIFMNIYSLHRQKTFQKKRNSLIKSIDNYLNEETTGNAVRPNIQGNDELWLGVVSQIAAGADSARRAKLIQLFHDFDMSYIPQNQIDNLRSKNITLRQRAATLLPFIADSDRIVEPLLNTLEDEMLDVRLAAARALGEIRCIAAIPAIINNLALPGNWPIQRVIEVINQMGKGSVKQLISYLHTPNISQSGQIIAIAGLGIHRGVEALPLIENLLNHGSLEVRIQCAKTLGMIGDKHARVVLCQAMMDDAWELRAASAHALGELGDEAGIEQLNSGLRDQNWWVRLNSANALYEIGGGGINALKLALGNSDRFACDISKLVLQKKGVAL